MFGPYAGTLALAFVDSINPSAFAVTIYLLLTSQKFLSRLLVYILGIVALYFTGGVLLVLGVDQVLSRATTLVDDRTWYMVQGVVGVALILLSFFPPGRWRSREEGDRTPRSLGHVSLFFLGVGISAVEFGTALPYLGAVGIITTSHLAPHQWALLLLSYNIIMILPLLGMAVAYKLLGDRIRGNLERIRDTLRSGMRDTWLWIMFVIGIFLVLGSTSSLMNYYSG